MDLVFLLLNVQLILGVPPFSLANNKIKWEGCYIANTFFTCIREHYFFLHNLHAMAIHSSSFIKMACAKTFKAIFLSNVIAQVCSKIVQTLSAGIEKQTINQYVKISAHKCVFQMTI